MMKNKQGKKLRLFFSVTAVICMGILSVIWLPAVQMKASQAITWIRVALNPAGALPTAEVKKARQEVFWLPDFMNVQSGSTFTSESVQAKNINTTLPVSVALPSPAFNPRKDYQDWNNCGPATLALGLRYWGWEGDQFTISEVIRPKRQDKNVNIEEMAQYVNEYADGLAEELRAEVRIGGDPPLLEALIASGYPVIIEEAFRVEKSAWPGDDLWAGHYILLTGYDQHTQLFTAQDSYFGPDRMISYADVVHAWQAFNHVYLVLFPEDELPKIQQLLGKDWQVDANFRRTAANLHSQVMLEPGNAFAWFNLGSSLVALQDYDTAAQAFDKARKLGLPQRMLRYQFGPLLAAYQTGNYKDLALLADYALNVTPDSEEALLWKSWAFEMAGDHQSAISLINQSLKANPGYQEAIKALAIVRP